MQPPKENLIPQASQMPPSTAGMTTKVVKGSLWTLAGQVLPLGISLFTTPFVIRMLGTEGYGVLILIGLIPTYFAFADLGMGIASTKFASEAYAEGDAEREASIVHTAAALSFILSIPIAALLFIFSNSILGLFNVPEQFHTEANISLKIAAVTFVINFLNSIFNTPQLTRLRMDLNTFVNSGFRMLGLIATPITIYLGGGIVGATSILLLVSLLTFVANTFVSGKLLREFFPFLFNRAVVNPMLKFGFALSASMAATVLIVNIEKGILAKLSNAKELAYYSIAFTLASMITLFSNSLLQALIPAFSQMQNRENKNHLEFLYTRSIRLNILLTIPAITLLIMICKPFFSIWAGEDFGNNCVVPFYFLLGGIAFNIVGLFPHALLIAKGRTDLFTKVYWLEIVPYFIVVWFMVKELGISGAALGWSLRIVFDTIIFSFLTKRISQIGSQSLFDRPLMILILSSLIPLGAYFGGHLNTIIQSLVYILWLFFYCFYVYNIMLFKSEKDFIKGFFNHFFPLGSL